MTQRRRVAIVAQSDDDELIFKFYQAIKYSQALMNSGTTIMEIAERSGTESRALKKLPDACARDRAFAYNLRQKITDTNTGGEAKGPLGFLTRKGDARRLRIYYDFGEQDAGNLDALYWIEGFYIEPSLSEIYYFFSLAAGGAFCPPIYLIDTLVAAHNILNTKAPIVLTSAEVVDDVWHIKLRLRFPGVPDERACEAVFLGYERRY